MSACACIGAQRGEPLCPCQMRGVVQRGGRWVREQDLGPVSPTPAIFVPPVKITHGCVCPPGAELGCQGAFCPRRGAGGALQQGAPNVE